MKIEEFTQEGKNFVYIDLANLKSVEQFHELGGQIKSVIRKYPENSVYTITNIDNMRLDSEAKNIVAEYMSENKPFVRGGVFIGIDGVKKVMATEIFKMIGRKNMSFAFTKDQAIKWLLQQGAE